MSTTAKPAARKKPAAKKAPAKRPAAPKAVVTTGDTLMKLRALIVERTREPWYTLAKINPVDFDNPASPFVVAARLPTGNEFVGQWPHDVPAATLEAIVDELLGMRAAAAQRVEEASVDADGNAIGDPRVEGKLVSVTLANGRSVEVMPRRTAPRESEQQEQARLEVELRSFPLVTVEVNEPQPIYVGWNGQGQWLQPGENTVPSPIADAYRASKRDGAMPLIDLDSRLLHGLRALPTYDQLEAIIEQQAR